MFWFLISLAQAAPVFGLEYRPLSRGDLEAVARDDTSGLLVGEFDGLVRPQLTAMVGVALKERLMLLGGLGIARTQVTTWESDVFVLRHWGVIRPSVDLRTAFSDRVLNKPVPYGLFGLYANIPSARDVSNGYDEEEQLAADRGATSDRQRLSGLGLRLGFGVGWRVHENLEIAGQYAMAYHQRLFGGTEPAVINSRLTSEASIICTVQWGKKVEEEAEE